MATSAKTRMLNFLNKTEGYNSFSTAQARNYFGIQNVAARIHELRQDGVKISTDVRTRGNGSSVVVYRLNAPKKVTKRSKR